MDDVQARRLTDYLTSSAAFARSNAILAKHLAEYGEEMTDDERELFASTIEKQKRIIKRLEREESE